MRQNRSPRSHAVLVIPHWQEDTNIGNVRIRAMLRWLEEANFQITIVCSGALVKQQERHWGSEIVIPDPLRKHRRPHTTNSRTPNRQTGSLKGRFAARFLLPDATIFWAKYAARHQLTLQACRDADFVLSSNPPESAHIGARILARILRIPHIVDMRDGWVDEPLKPLLAKSRVRRILEARLEAKVLRDASIVFVTSDVWKELLVTRRPSISPKVRILTNGYPTSGSRLPPARPSKENDSLLLVHGGRFGESNRTRSPALLLNPLLEALPFSGLDGEVALVGSLSGTEQHCVRTLAAKFASSGWRLSSPGHIAREDLLPLLNRADGLLLLSTFRAQLPRKLFEYIYTGRPILAVTSRHSATGRLCSSLDQGHVFDPAAHDLTPVYEFLDACRSRSRALTVPEEFSDKFLKGIYLKTVNQVINAQPREL